MDAKSPEFMKAVQELRVRALPDTPELHSRLKNALDAQYWRELNPTMAVCGSEPSQAIENPGLDPSSVARRGGFISWLGTTSDPLGIHVRSSGALSNQYFS